jgi:hypothetical protein
VILTDTDKLLLSGLLPNEAGRRRLQLLFGKSPTSCQLVADLVSEPLAKDRDKLTACRTFSIEWEALIRRAEMHGIAPLVRFNLSHAGMLDQVPPQPRRSLDHQAYLQAARHLACVSEASRLIREMKAAGLTALPLKGAALMLGDYYPQAGLRAAADIDLLVRPDELEAAERIAHACGYVVKKYPEAEPGTTLLPPRAAYRLPAELNHAEARGGPGGLMLELHRRAFHYARGARDFGFAEMIARAAPQQTEDSNRLLLPAAEDLALHLIHHTIVDLRSTHLILRTLADLHFIGEREPELIERLKQRAAEMGLGEAVATAIELLRLIREGTLEELEHAARRGKLAALLEAALQESTAALAAAASVFEHYDVRQSLTGAVRSMVAIAFTSKEHLARDYDQANSDRVYLYYPRRVFEMMKKFNWRSLRPATLRRIIRLRRIGRPQSADR